MGILSNTHTNIFTYFVCIGMRCYYLLLLVLSLFNF
nr:MAG TPA: hypothetical protein [Caudoviricetes sp.]